MQTKHFLAFASLLVAASAASAAPSVGSGGYALLDAGASRASGLVDETSTSPTVGGTLGYNLSKSWAIETGYKNFGDRSGVKFEAVSLSAVALVPLSTSFALVSKAGIARTMASTKVPDPASSNPADTLTGGILKTGFVVGAGIDYELTRNVTVRAMFDVYPDFAGSHERMSNLSVGVKYQF